MGRTVSEALEKDYRMHRNGADLGKAWKQRSDAGDAVGT